VEINREKLHDFIKLYKAYRAEHGYADENKHRWEAVKGFQENWKECEQGFYQMLMESSEYAHGLRKKPNGFLFIGVIRSFAYPDKAEKEMYIKLGKLFDENESLMQRVRTFGKEMKELFESLSGVLNRNEYWIKDKAPLNNVEILISMCLWLRFPYRYYIYEDDVVKVNAQKLCVDGKQLDMCDDIYERMEFGYELYDAIFKELAENTEIVSELVNIPDDWFPDGYQDKDYKDKDYPNIDISQLTILKMLTIDIGYFIREHDVSPSEEIVSSTVVQTEDENIADDETQDKNIILYGPPGTGKTYSTVLHAVSIIEKEELENIKKEGYKKVFDRYQELKKAGQIAFTTFHQSYGYEEFIEGIGPVLNNDNNGGKDIKYNIQDGIFKKFCQKAKKTQTKPYVFIIDEINRGNISKIFGELITLIEPTKRFGASEEQIALLPYSSKFKDKDEDKMFCVPKNVFIIGTMNTADRSIAMIDTALRRRFKFIEMQPNPELLKDVEIEGSINIKEMFETINKRITFLLDHEHTIGHSYFMSLNNNSPIGDLGKIFKNEIIPLLQEYFYDDYEKIRLVLGDNQKPETQESEEDNINFIVKKDAKSLFGNADEDDKFYYEINRNEEVLSNIEAYKYLKEIKETEKSK